MAQLKSIDELLGENLSIPSYQRPYKWTVKNIHDLLSDITNAINEAEKYTKFKYRIGTIIVYSPQEETFNSPYEIVDGQQRIISLLLIKLCIEPNFTHTIFKQDFSNKTTQLNIHNNYLYIKEWIAHLKDDDKEKIKIAFKDILEVVFITVNNIAEAFQLFDSQNTRGKPLAPHDLLKAYHLREMLQYPYEMVHSVKKWEEKDSDEIKNLFENYLFPIWNWAQGKKSSSFTTKEIDTYKGMSESSPYTYAKRANKAMPYFQITEPFIAGKSFFEMVEHYWCLKEDIEKEISNNDNFKILKDICNEKDNSVGFENAKNLFYCALLFYYDRFHNFNELSVYKLFTWAFMIRVDMENLGLDTINKYAVGESNPQYTNVVPMFSRIHFARLHNEISCLQIKVKRGVGDEDRAKKDKWQHLYNELKKINGIE